MKTNDKLTSAEIAILWTHEIEEYQKLMILAKARKTLTYLPW